MKTLLTIAGSLALGALLLPARAQAPATTPGKPTPTKPAAKPAAPRGAAYGQGASTPPTTKQAVGRKFIEKSKPTDSTVPTRPRPSSE